MVWTVKTLLKCLGLAGTSCAIAVPVATYGVSKNSKLRDSPITKCDNTYSHENEITLIGAEGERNICGKMEKVSDLDEEEGDVDEEGGINSTEEAKITDLLKTLGSGEEGVDYGDGIKECNKGKLKGSLSDSSEHDNSLRVLGYCDPNLGSDDSNDSTINFVEFKNIASTNKDISVCVSGKECGTDDISTEIPVIFQQKSANHGRVIKFFRTK